MKWLCILLSLISGFVLLAAAFVHLVDSKRGERLLQQFLQQFRLLFLILLALYVASALVNAAGFSSVLVFLPALSIVAYFVRENRRPQREKTPNPGGAERTPVVPLDTRPTEADEPEDDT